MLERLIVDISKWIGYIILFFIAFGCALYLLYSPYSAILDQHNDLSRIQLPVSGSSSNNNGNNQTMAQCPDLFYVLVNQSNIVMVIDNSANQDNSYYGSNDDFCQQSPNYGTLQELGSYPALHYFGQSFRSTVLTTFFALFW